MPVAIGTTFAPHRAHIVRGILAAADVKSHVWGEQQAHLWCPGFLKCTLVVDDEDWEAAREIIESLPDQAPENDTSHEVAGDWEKFPGFVLCCFTPVVFLSAFSLAGILFQAVFQIMEGGVMENRGDDDAGIPFFFSLLSFAWVTAPLWAAVIQLLFLPLRSMDKHPWGPLLSYLLIRVGPVILAVLAALAASVISGH